MRFEWVKKDMEEAQAEIARLEEEIHEATLEFAYREDVLGCALEDETGYYDLEATQEEYDRAENVLAELNEEMHWAKENYRSAKDAYDEMLMHH